MTAGTTHEDWVAAMDRVAELEALAHTLRDIHYDFNGEGFCSACGTSYPCRTVRLVNRAVFGEND